MMKDDLEEKFLENLNANLGIVHRICRIYVKDSEDHDDLFQEIVYQLWKSYPGFQGNSKFSTWMYRVALNTAIGGVRKKYKTVKQEPLSTKFLQIADHENTDDAEQLQKLYYAIQQLSAVDKAIIMLFLEKNDNEQIAEIMGITKNLVSVKLVRIKKKLEVLLKNK